MIVPAVAQGTADAHLSIHKTTTVPSWNGHAVLAGHQQYRSNIKDRAAPPLFRVGSRVAKCSTCWSKPCPGRLGVAGQGIFAVAESAERYQRVPQREGGAFFHRANG
jgi:hypothetical protein